MLAVSLVWIALQELPNMDIEVVIWWRIIQTKKKGANLWLNIVIF